MDGMDIQHNGNWNANAEQLLRPVTVRQMLDAIPAHTGANLAIDGNEFVHITTVAHLVKLVEHPTKFEFFLEDGTRGRITARQWRSDDYEDDAGVDDLLENSYVRVVGSLERFSGHNYLRVIKIRKAVDYHELCFHLLEVMVTTLTYERGPPPRDNPMTSMIGQHVLTPTDGPSASQADHQNIFETSFAMHAMHDSLPVSPLSVDAPMHAPTVQSPVLQQALIDSAPSRLTQLDTYTCYDVSDRRVPGSFSSVLPKSNKGKARAAIIGDTSSKLPLSTNPLVFNSVNVASASSPSNVEAISNSLTSSPIGFTPVDIPCSSSSFLARDKSTSQSPHNGKTTAASVTREPSTEDESLPTQSPALHYLSGRKLEPYIDVSVLGQRIISIIMDTEWNTSTEAVSEYEGVHVGIIMDQLMTQDESITPYTVDVEISSLISEGYIYTTVDDLHVKVTQSH
ncbi:hypothetical protein PILCRDRAFT_302207 [Piloderma croceum F 1598]|uniref:Replication protein A C-terminal domain-containing protein n=1 Tax=Piloderma croceum (strain F 1598) TaxID=765440 RepID=A0A0C3CBW8_PILCF|nr:hypothetical protein PILCRDRAFT_302207 [Piloderma croceum F 1598]